MTAPASGPRWTLTLYVNGMGPRSTEAITAVRAVCDQEIPGRFELTVVDALEHPHRLAADEIVAVPTLVKHSPDPPRFLVGNFHDLDRVRLGLDLGPPTAAPVDYDGSVS